MVSEMTNRGILLRTNILGVLNSIILSWIQQGEH